jgi:hypothetical protein
MRVLPCAVHVLASYRSISLWLDIVFNTANAVVPDIGWSYLHDFDALRSIGDMFVSRLAINLGL